MLSLIKEGAENLSIPFPFNATGLGERKECVLVNDEQRYFPMQTLGYGRISQSSRVCLFLISSALFSTSADLAAARIPQL